MRQLEDSLAETLGASVTIDAKKNGSGTLKVHYRNLEQLDEILKKKNQRIKYALPLTEPPITGKIQPFVTQSFAFSEHKCLILMKSLKE